MTKRFDVLTQQLFQKNIDECTVEELEALAHEHPYFAPAQYALLTKLKETNSPSYSDQFQKAILYYHDALSFDQFISEEDHEIDLPLLQEVQEVITSVETESSETISAEPHEFQQEELIEEIEEKQDDKETEHENATTEQIIEEHKNDEKIVEAATVIVNEAKVEETVAVAKVEDNSNTGEIQNEPALAINTPKSGNDLTFEPYHTVDYFASQGIKLSQEEATKDKFGKQLRSFTEWLKTMKKIPAAEQVKTLDDNAEKKVENLAAHSVEGEEVYTETMAEVWVRQGNREKAIEIYNKLSLLNPSKMAYFAAKIDSLKI